MRLTPILIQEGRKEDLRKKYIEKFKEYPETLDFILGISDLADTNFKYANFVLKYTHPNASPEEVEDIVELVKDFDRFKESLENKDINQYDLVGLNSVIDTHKANSKSQLKKIVMEMMDVSSDSPHYVNRRRKVEIGFDDLAMLGSFSKRWCEDKMGLPDCQRVREIFSDYGLMNESKNIDEFQVDKGTDFSAFSKYPCIKN
jgi:hypothetical protein